MTKFAFHRLMGLSIYALLMTSLLSWSPELLAQGTDSASDAQASKSSDDELDKEELLGLSQVQLISRVTHVEEQLATYRQLLKVPDSLARLQNELDREQATLTEELEVAKEKVLRAWRWFVVTDIRFIYTERLRSLRQKQEPFDRFVARVGHIPRQLDQLQKEWEQVRDGLNRVGAQRETQVRVARLIQSIQLTRIQANTAESLIVRVGSRSERMEGAITAFLKLTEEGGPTLISDFDYRSQEVMGRVSFEQVKQRLAGTVEWNWGLMKQFGVTNRLKLGIHLVIFFALIWAMREARKFHQAQSVRGTARDQTVLAHPYASACILAAFLALFFYAAIPAAGGLLVFAFAVASSQFLLLDSPIRNGLSTFFGVWMIVVVLALHLLFSELPRLEGFTLPGEAIVVGFLCYLQIKHPPQNLSPSWSRFARLVSRCWVFCCALGLLAWALGFLRSASILIDGSARMLLATVAYRLAYDVCCGLIELGTTSPWAMQLRVFRIHRDVVVRRLELVLMWTLVVLWSRSMLRTYTVYGTVKQALSECLAYSFQAGSLDFSLRSVFVLMLGLGLALGAAKVTRFVLTEELMPRTSLRIGGQAALTSSLYYVALGFGVFLTLAATGIELGKVAILVSALGVGIGFGLQNVVSNFIAGVIVMIERPVNVGDKIQLVDMFGVVEKIGFRASRVRTFEGAEVIVPNSQLVADRVINWSLTDDRRRIEVNIGVAYGTEPELVQAIFLKVADENPDILKVPAPDAIFVGFGESALNFQLRGHTDNGSNWVVIRSNLNIALNRELKAAGIDIPYPQRDLHLRVTV